MAKESKKRKSVKNLYDKDTGLSIMINLYVIKYIYYHINKAECFIEERTPGRKPKSYPIYGNEIPMSRQRFDRINRGMTFEVTANEFQEIRERFGIDKRYFDKEGSDIFEIEGLTLTDWKCFYNQKYEGGYDLPNSFQEEEGTIEEKSNNVEKVIGTLISEGWEKRIAKDNPLYAICYYFANGSRYDKPNVIEQFRQALSKIEYQDWDGVDMVSLNADFKVLKRHLSYMNSLITLYNMRNEKNKK